MSLFQLNMSKYSVATNQPTPICEIYTYLNKIAILEISILSRIAMSTNVNFGIGRPLTIGIPDTRYSKYGIPLEPSENNFLFSGGSQVYASTLWKTLPSQPSVFFRRTSFKTATAGASITWNFPRGLIVNPNSSIVLHQISSSQGIGWDLNFTITYEE